MALDFPDPSLSPFTASNGVVYIWNAAGYWEASVGGASPNGDYLLLDALAPAQTRASTNTVTFNCDLDLKRNLTVDVLSTFKGLSTHEAGVSVTGGELSALYANLNFKGGRTGKVLGIYEGLADDDGANPKISLNNDGSAAFAGGNLDIGSDGLLRVKRSAPNGSGGLVVYPDNDFSADATVAINTDGSASFAGDGHFKCGGTDPEHGVQFINDGEVKIWRPTGGGASVNLISGSAGTGSQNEMFAIKADGSAEFAGTVVVGPADTTSNSANGVRIINSGSVTAQRQSTQGSSSLFTGLLGTANTFQVLANGNATFAGQVNIGNDIASASGTRIYNNGALYLRSDVSAGNSIFKYYNGGFGDPNVKINFSADGSASFEGCVRGKASVNTDAAIPRLLQRLWRDRCSSCATDEQPILAKCKLCYMTHQVPPISHFKFIKTAVLRSL